MQAYFCLHYIKQKQVKCFGSTLYVHLKDDWCMPVCEFVFLITQVGDSMDVDSILKQLEC